MASQQQPATRQWFRLPSIARPVIPATETPEPRGPVPRTTFKPIGQSPAGVSSVPTSPIKRTSVPSSPVQAPRTSPTPTTTSSVPSLPKPQVSAPSASLPSPKPALSPPKPSTSSMPTSPPKPVPSSPAKPVPTSPPKPLPTTYSVPTSSPKLVPTSPPKPVPTVATGMPLPIPFSRMLKPAVQSPPQSPKTKPTAPPPSPLILPPPQLNSKAELEPKIPAETEQKTVLVQTTSEKPKTWLNGTGHHNDFDQSHKYSIGHHGKHEVSEDVFGKKEKGHRKKFSSDSDEGSMRVITIAGENKGAFMEVIKSPLKHSFDGNSHTLQHKGNSKTETGWHSSSSSSSEEGNSKMKDKSNKEKALHSPPMGAYMNSNVQGVNNSIVFNSSSSHHDPGVHLSLARKPYGHGIHVKDTTKGHN